MALSMIVLTKPTMSTPLPPLHCPNCGTVALPRLRPGTGPHPARADCSKCGRFLKWLPKRLAQPIDKAQETKRHQPRGPAWDHRASGVEVINDARGVPCASFTLEVQEPGRDGQASSTLMPCTVWGAKAESAIELEAGQLVCVEGKLRKRQRGETGKLVVSGWEVTMVGVPSSASELPERGIWEWHRSDVGQTLENVGSSLLCPCPLSVH
jgi:single-stranded DNA-binding protein